MLYGVKGEVPDAEEDYLLPLGKAAVKREGTDVTVVATSSMVGKALKAAETLEKDGISVEVVDPRSLRPLDVPTLAASVKKTGRLVLVDEAPETGNAMVEVARRIQDEAFTELKKSPLYVCGPDTPIPFAPQLEDEWIVNEQNIIDGIKNALK